MSQTALEIDGLVPPFWAEIWRHHVERRTQEDELHALLLTCSWGEDDGQHHVTAIGDQRGELWRRDFLDWVPAARAPWPDPYEKLERDL